jgi:hypothetical protein
MTTFDPTRFDLALRPHGEISGLCPFVHAPDLARFRAFLEHRLSTIGAPEVHVTTARAPEHPGELLLFHDLNHTWVAHARVLSWEVSAHPMLTLERIHHWDVWEVPIEPARLVALRTLSAKLARKRGHADYLRPRVPIRHHRSRRDPAEMRARISGLRHELDRALDAQRHFIQRGEPPAWHLSQLVFTPYRQRTQRGQDAYPIASYPYREPFDHVAEHCFRWQSAQSFNIDTTRFTFL